MVVPFWLRATRATPPLLVSARTASPPVVCAMSALDMPLASMPTNPLAVTAVAPSPAGEIVGPKVLAAMTAPAGTRTLTRAAPSKAGQRCATRRTSVGEERVFSVALDSVRLPVAATPGVGSLATYLPHSRYAART